MNKLYAILFNALLDISKAYVEEGSKCYASETVVIAFRSLERFGKECQKIIEITKIKNDAVDLAIVNKIDYMAIGLGIIAMSPVLASSEGKNIVSAITTKDVASMLLEKLKAM